VLVQLWKARGAGYKHSADAAGADAPPDDTLELKVRYRMSMSLLYDSVSRWREEILDKMGNDKFEAAVRNPSSPEVPLQDRVSPAALTVGSTTPNEVLLDPANFGTELPRTFGAFNGTPAFTGLNPIFPPAQFPNHEYFDSMSWFLDEVNPSVFSPGNITF